MIQEAMAKFTPQNDAPILWIQILEYGSDVFHRTRRPSDLRVKWRNLMKKEPAGYWCWQCYIYVAVAFISFESTWNTDVVLVDSECANSSLQVGMEGFLTRMFLCLVRAIYVASMKHLSNFCVSFGRGIAIIITDYNILVLQLQLWEYVRKHDCEKG